MRLKPLILSVILGLLLWGAVAGLVCAQPRMFYDIPRAEESDSLVLIAGSLRDSVFRSIPLDMLGGTYTFRFTQDGTGSELAELQEEMAKLRRQVAFLRSLRSSLLLTEAEQKWLYNNGEGRTTEDVTSRPFFWPFLRPWWRWFAFVMTLSAGIALAIYVGAP